MTGCMRTPRRRGRRSLMRSPLLGAARAPRVQWKAVGDAGWEARVDHCMALAEHFEAALQAPR